MIPAPRRRRLPLWFGAEAVRALAMGGAVACLAMVCGWPYWAEHRFAAMITLLGCGGFAVVGGLLSTGRRSRRTGLLFVFASVAWALNWLVSWNAGAGPLVSLYAQADFYLALAVGVLIYPSGRLDSRVDRIWAGLAAVILWGGPTALLFTSRPEWAAFKATVWWPAPFPDHEIFRGALKTLGVLYLCLALSFAVVLLLRLPRMRRLERALAFPVTVALAFVGITAALTQRPIMEEAIRLEELLRVYVLQGAVAILVPLALLGSGLRLRFGELTVAGRMLRLGSPVSVERVRRALREALDDPALELWFWASTEKVYVDAAGHPVDLAPESPGADAQGDDARWRQEVRTATGGPLAIVDLSGPLREHASLVEAALVAGGRALETAQLQATVQANLEQVRSAYERLVRAEAAERERLVRDLHDGAQQRLLALGAMLGTLEAVTDDAAVRAHARECRLELLAALAELRSLAREVRPALLVQDGIGPALEVAAEGLGTRVRVEVTRERFPREIESTLFSVLCEVLGYAVERAHAGHISVRVRPAEQQLIAEVSDDGERAADLGAELAGITGRIKALRGQVETEEDPTKGSMVRIILPCE